MTLNKGDQAPAFRLVSSDKQEVSLDDYQGKNVVLLFFPLAFTSVCTTQLCTMRDSLADYNQLNTEVVGISVDSPFTLNRYKQDQQLNFTLLSDFNKEASQAYGAFYESFMLGLKGVSKRAAFVVDQHGKVQYAEVLERAADLPDFQAIKQAVSSLNPQ
jgi:peroxiredoxin